METTERKSEYICGREELLSERGFELIVFRADDGGRIISGFPASKLGRGVGSVYNRDFGGAGQREYILNMLSGYSRAPFLVNIGERCVLIVRGMVPAANLAAALILDASPDCVGSLAAAGTLDLVVLPPGERGLGGSGCGPRAAEITERVYGYTRGGFYSLNQEDMSDAGESVRKIGEALRCLSYIACCGCTLAVDEKLCRSLPYGLNRKFDGDIFTVFTLLSLLACGRAGIGRGAGLKYGIFDGEPGIDIECELLDDAGSLPEIDECRRIADRRRLFYESSVIKTRGASKLKIRFCPARYEWSALGIKSVNRLDYNL